LTPRRPCSILPGINHKITLAIRREGYSDQALWVTADFADRIS
jgi:hypothetical protein